MRRTSKPVHFVLTATILVFCAVNVHAASVVWFDKPAAKWEQAQPVGNGRIGAMVFGGVAEDRIQFNESTVWNGHPHDYARPDAPAHLAELRQLIFDGKDKEVKDLSTKVFLSNPQEAGALSRQKAYQPFGDLMFRWSGLEGATKYRRDLDLSSAVQTTSFDVNGVTYKRDVFASYPDQVLVVHLTASQPGKLTFTMNMTSPHKVSNTTAVGTDTLSLTGQVQPDGIKFESRIKLMTQGGEAKIDGNAFSVHNADSATLILSAASSYKNYEDISADPAARCVPILEKAAGQSYETLLQKHTADFKALFDRVKLDLGTPKDEPTDQRKAAIKPTKGKDPDLASDPDFAALYFNFGRYLLISSSREGAGNQPANLQGIWNYQTDPPWDSKWTTNINVEMNYWPAEETNLTECTPPLFDMIDDLVKSGERTAKEEYNCRGWVLHHNTDIWRATAPINGIDGMWPTGGAWLCDHLWDHYRFTLDKDFLAKRAYPVMKDACVFFEDFLVKDPKTGWLVTCPAYSPEQGTVCAGPTMDVQLVSALMDHTLAAAKILNIDADFCTELAKVRAQLAPMQIGKEGQLQEWLTDIDKPNNNHRHMSPLWGLYPGDQLTPADPKLFDAAKVLLKWRGDGSTGWSYAWRINLWARVGDGEMAYHQLTQLLDRKTMPSLLDLCGPFQIDGNFGAPAGMAEMLLQSHQHAADTPDVPVIELLPALPSEWAKGSITGLCARGGFVVDIAWDGGKLASATVRSKLGTPCVVKYGAATVDLQAAAGTYQVDGQLHVQKQ